MTLPDRRKELLPFLVALIYIVAIIILSGCSQWFPSEPYEMPPCKWVPIYRDGDSTKAIVAYYLAPGQTIGVVITCDQTKGHP